MASQLLQRHQIYIFEMAFSEETYRPKTKNQCRISSAESLPRASATVDNHNDQYNDNNDNDHNDNNNHYIAHYNEATSC